MSYDNWIARMAGQKVTSFLQAQAEDEGYYRKPVTEKLPNGRNKILGYVPVAYFLDTDGDGPEILHGVIGAGENLRNMTDAEVNGEDIWSYVCRNPISYETYVDVVDDGKPWPDESKWLGVEIEPLPRRLSDNQPDPAQPDAEVEPAAPVEPPKPRHELLAAAIAREIAAAPKKVEALDQAELAAGAKNRIAELRLTANREGEAEYKPAYAEYKRLFDRWTPMVKAGEAEEKRLNTAVLRFRESERQKAAAAAAKAAQEAQDQADAIERAAQRAIAQGEPEMPPPVAEAPPPQAPPVVPTYGTRKVKEELKLFAVIGDWASAFEHFQNDAELRARLEKLCTDAVRAGATIPGVTTREGLI